MISSLLLVLCAIVAAVSGAGLCPTNASAVSYPIRQTAETHPSGAFSVSVAGSLLISFPPCNMQFTDFSLAATPSEADFKPVLYAGRQDNSSRPVPMFDSLLANGTFANATSPIFPLHSVPGLNHSQYDLILFMHEDWSFAQVILPAITANSSSSSSASTNGSGSSSSPSLTGQKSDVNQTAILFGVFGAVGGVGILLVAAYYIKKRRNPEYIETPYDPKF